MSALIVIGLKNMFQRKKAINNFVKFHLKSFKGKKYVGHYCKVSFKVQQIFHESVFK